MNKYLIFSIVRGSKITRSFHLPDPAAFYKTGIMLSGIAQLRSQKRHLSTSLCKMYSQPYTHMACVSVQTHINKISSHKPKPHYDMIQLTVEVSSNSETQVHICFEFGPHDRCSVR